MADRRIGSCPFVFSQIRSWSPTRLTGRTQTPSNFPRVRGVRIRVSLVWKVQASLAMNVIAVRQPATTGIPKGVGKRDRRDQWQKRK